VVIGGYKDVVELYDRKANKRPPLSFDKVISSMQTQTNPVSNYILRYLPQC